jgi:hypothetical protein
MSSLLTEFKQIPVNAGYYVCIKDASAVTFSVSGDSYGSSISPGPLAGAQFMDLGVTRVARNGTPIPTDVYRKVVPVTVPMGANPTEVFIKIGGATANFARMG